MNSTKFPHSLGVLYQAITQFLGFKAYGDEYKVMGLAPYGEPHLIHVAYPLDAESSQEVVASYVENKVRDTRKPLRTNRELVKYLWYGPRTELGAEVLYLNPKQAHAVAPLAKN